MSTCTVCQKDSMEHSKKLWEMHKQVTICEFCDKSSGSHSEELWEMHKGTIEAARRKTRHKKLWTVQIGTGRNCPALLDKDFSYNSNLNMAEWLVPIYMSCTECGLYLSSMRKTMRTCWVECAWSASEKHRSVSLALKKRKK